jgi:hypothetical protein
MMFDQKRLITIVLVSMKTKTKKKNIFFSFQNNHQLKGATTFEPSGIQSNDCTERLVVTFRSGLLLKNTCKYTKALQLFTKYTNVNYLQKLLKKAKLQ